MTSTYSTRLDGSTVLFVVGMTDRFTDRFADVADAGHDRVGLALEEDRLPERIRLPTGIKRKPIE